MEPWVAAHTGSAAPNSTTNHLSRFAIYPPLDIEPVLAPVEKPHGSSRPLSPSTMDPSSYCTRNFAVGAIDCLEILSFTLIVNSYMPGSRLASDMLFSSVIWSPALPS